MSEIAATTIHPDYADILVACPMPGQEDQAPITLGEFAETERGQKYAAGIIETSELYEKAAGLSKEAAMRKALGGAAVTNESGELMRKPQEEQAISQPQTPEAKKK
ncbi:MAG: hypothetical protein JWL89_198 [Candidatus Saccharibacteria bacterium]|nr:hypothetical protein [Candidatus Saccharibacteria bacterium]